MLAEILVLLAAVGGSAWIVGTLGWLLHRLRMVERNAGPDGHHLRAEMASLREELSEGRRGMAQLRERVEFVERLLERDGVPPRLPAPPEARHSGDAE